MRDATWSCSAWGPSAKSVLPLWYSMAARRGVSGASGVMLKCAVQSEGTRSSCSGLRSLLTRERKLRSD
uniref:Secreted protein n=1 Tax=Peronospora matthiolae TaxID=2874970 RepID=A0AAV1UC29_9STRA